MLTNVAHRNGAGEWVSMTEPGYYSADDGLYYVTASGTVFLVGDEATDPERPVWEPRDAPPEDAEPSDLAPDFAQERGMSRIQKRIA